MSNNNQPNTVEEELGPPKADFSAPPPYELTNSHCNNTVVALQSNALTHNQQQQQQQQQQQNSNTQADLQFHRLQLQQQPQHGHQLHGQSDGQGLAVHHGKLPTYEEVQMEKSLNGELPPEFLTAHILQQPLPPPPPNPLLANLRDSSTIGGGGGNSPSNAGAGLTFIAIDANDADNLAHNPDSNLLGTDIMFIMAFMVAFLFNWIGFLMLTCFCHTIAARYGALSGFGLSLAKWTLIVKNSTDLASHENSWLWWLIMAFGFLICVRALIQYVSIKRTWRLLSTSAQERLLFFY